jgi:hypothetical protein
MRLNNRLATYADAHNYMPRVNAVWKHSTVTSLSVRERRSAW